MNKWMKRIAVLAGLIAVSEAGGAAYFYRRTMKRSHAKTERTVKMAGTDWNQHMAFIRERRERLDRQQSAELYQTTDDGLRLHAVYYPNNNSKKVVICLHGYTSNCSSDFVAMSDYYLRNGFGILMPDARAHGESEGTYIGFGCLDRYDLLGWIQLIIEKCGPDVEIVLHGNSMGGATVLMASGLDLPSQVKGIISDCGFTSPKEVFTHVLHTMYHLPAFPMLQIADITNRRKAGFGLDDCNAAREVQKATLPILLIHGDADTFVPSSMCEKIYENCTSPKSKLIVPGAAHAESYYKDTDAYEKALDTFIGGIVK